jgi:menaquinone-9 beta-reductase
MTFDADVIIVGAGPTGCTVALTLREAGQRVLMLDRATFPRDKVCGDAIPGLAIKTLSKIDPRLTDRFDQQPGHLRTRRTRFAWEQSQGLEVSWVLPAYTCARLDFDAAMLALVRQHSDTEIREGVQVKAISTRPGGVQLETSHGPLRAQLVIGCDGSRSTVARALRPAKIDPLHHGGAVRQYWRGVAGLQSDRTEIFVQKAFLPGYFWVFPLPDGLANVGFGMRSDEIARRRINLKQALQDFVAASPELQRRFASAEPLGKVQGYGLPFASQQIKISGERLLLAGDAASLVDPFSGDGIGYGVLSGYLAGQQARNSLAQGDCSAATLAQYDQALWRQIGPELRRKTRFQRLLNRQPWLAEVGLRMAQIPPLRRWIQNAV